MCKGIPLLGVDEKVLCCNRNFDKDLLALADFLHFCGVVERPVIRGFLFRLTVSRSYCLFFCLASVSI